MSSIIAKAARTSLASKRKHLDARDVAAACFRQGVVPDRFMAAVEKARLERLINENSAETGRLIEENLTLDTKVPAQSRRWYANSDRISELFAQHDKLLKAYSKAGKR